jgi:hypothetical protein
MCRADYRIKLLTTAQAVNLQISVYSAARKNIPPDYRSQEFLNESSYPATTDRAFCGRLREKYHERNGTTGGATTTG